MTSAINPNNIDGQYPVAGQDNNSQGFRDNFTNTSTNFEYAAIEITELQNKAILKTALTGGTLQNNMGNAVISNAQLIGQTTNVVTLGNVTASTANIVFGVGSYQTATTQGNTQLNLTGWPSSGLYATVRLQLTTTAANANITLPATVSQGLTGIQGLAGNVITVAQTGTYNFEFTTSDGGTTVTIQDLNRPLSVYTNPLFLDVSDSFVANSNISLTTTTTIINSSGNLVGNLLAGTSGQVKILAYGNASAGNTLVNVVNAGWKSTGNGTANLSATGSAATFQYIGSKWFCVGNNGVSFS
jgi:hypothetical protein